MQFGIEVKDDWGALLDRLQQLKKIPQSGVEIMAQAVPAFEQDLRRSLAGQGRSGGSPPPLSGATRRIYAADGEPTGSGILDHISWETLAQTNERYTGIAGVAEGKPTMLLIVQNDGCVVPVSDKMRGFLAARYGIFLKRTTLVIVIPGRGVWDQAWQRSLTATMENLRQLFEDWSN